MSSDEEERQAVLSSGEESDSTAPSVKGAAEINDEVALKRLLNEISYKNQTNGKRYPWLERLDHVTKGKLPELDINANVEREKVIYENTLRATHEVLLKLKYLGIQFARPKDFMAEMMKSDHHMKKLQSKVEVQKIRMEKFKARANNPQQAKGSGASRKSKFQKDPSGQLSTSIKRLTKKRGVKRRR
eukprot:Blabericola_migrator_1__8093@NODE_4167_length_1299_cov_47_337662_g2579_i0_p1_GENE_NODE_4167_length_1299_cov_47_337662_g2579_i0NODE_4167_length_1299_cov_47_337662_g2579_i0_p1_ORF_typecomplete_len187_score45_95Ebp2/PF05890_12/4_5e29_NODE_4167_length_1299_cov_47_337662_g2579_i05651125